MVQATTGIYRNFKQCGTLMKWLCQFPVDNLSRGEASALRFSITSWSWPVSLLCFGWLALGTLPDEKSWEGLAVNFTRYQYLAFYCLNFYGCSKYVAFLKEIDLFDKKIGTLLIAEERNRSGYKKRRRDVAAVWLGSGVFLFSIRILIQVFCFGGGYKENWRKVVEDLCGAVVVSPILFQFINFAFTSDQLEDRFATLRISLRTTLMGRSQFRQNSSVAVENLRFLHLELTECCRIFGDSFYLVIPGQLYFAGLEVVLNVYAAFYLEVEGAILRVAVSLVYNFLLVFLLVYKSRRLVLVASSLDKELFDVPMQLIGIKLKHQLVYFHMQLKMKAMSIRAFGVDVSNWSFFASYTSSVATYIIALGQLYREINLFLHEKFHLEVQQFT